MTIVEVNTVDFGSTGKIMLGIRQTCETNGINCYCFSGAQRTKSNNQNPNILRFGSYRGYVLNYGAGYYTGYESCFSYLETVCLIKKIKTIKPDIIQLHNLHGSYINYALLFKYIRNNKIPVVWTLHDCWAFTGRCPHFQIIDCNQWKTGCCSCKYPQNQYPKTKRNVSHRLWRKKKKLFTGIQNLTIVTPSNWLAGLVGQSFLKDYPTKVIHNGIDLEVFKPTKSDFKDRIGLNKKIILGVSFGWGYKKGLDVFIRLAEVLPDYYQIVLVGTDDQVDEQLPGNILSIHRTQNQNELAEIYSSADVFFNPTREDTFPTVNMEAIACGCPVVTFNTGGCSEMLTEKTGYVLHENTVEEAYRVIRNVCENSVFKSEDCLNQARLFNMNDRFMEYVNLYYNL